MRYSEKNTAILPDFMPRNRTRATTHIILAFICTIIAALAALKLGNSHANADLATYAVCIILAVSCMITLYFRKRADDTVLATEFQNLIYSSATALGSQFCIITKRDGVAVHASSGLSEMFDGFPYTIPHALEGFFIEGRIPKFDQEKITNALLMNEKKSLLLKVSTALGINDMVINIDPLPRPHGYYAIKARYFQGARNSGSALLSNISPETMRLVLENSPVGHFICDDHGKFEYINLALAALVGRTPQSMLEDKLHVQHILKKRDGSSIGKDFEFSDMREEVLLIHENNAPIRLSLTLTLQREGGKTTAIVGTVTQD